MAGGVGEVPCFGGVVGVEFPVHGGWLEGLFGDDTGFGD